MQEARARQSCCLMLVNILEELELRRNSADELFQEAKSNRAKKTKIITRYLGQKRTD